MAYDDVGLFQIVRYFAIWLGAWIDRLDGMMLLYINGTAVVSLWDLMVGFLIMAFAISVFWKGARA